MLRLALRVPREAAERVAAELWELAPGGFEEVDRGEEVEYALYGAPGELPELPALRAAAGGGAVDVETTEVPADWAERWRAFHRPLEVAGRLRVRPPWEPPPQRGSGLADVVIDPGRAFGTGSHATTRLCLELLCGLAAGGASRGEPPARGSLLDAGCGSGVLAIAAARLGFAPVLACDHDPAGLEATRRNAAANGVEVSASRVDLRRASPPVARVVVANLTASLLDELADRLPDPPPRALIASGLLEREADAAARSFAHRGLRERDRRAADGWAALRLEAD